MLKKVLDDMIVIENILEDTIEKLDKLDFIDRTYTCLDLYSVNKFNTLDYLRIRDFNYYKLQGYSNFKHFYYYYYNCNKNCYNILVKDEHEIISSGYFLIKAIAKIIANNDNSKYNFILLESMLRDLFYVYRTEIIKKSDLSYLVDLHKIYGKSLKNINFYIHIQDFDIFRYFYKDYRLGIGYTTWFTTDINITEDKTLNKTLTKNIRIIKKDIKNTLNKNLTTFKLLFINYDYAFNRLENYKIHYLTPVFYIPNLTQLIQLYIIEFLLDYL